MKTKKLYVGSVILITVLSGCDSTPSGLASTSTQTSTAGATVSSGSGSNSRPEVTFTHFLYSANKGDNTISEFGINPNNGSLIPIVGHEAISTSSQPIVLGLTPNKKFLYVLSGNEGVIRGYTVDSTSGALTQIPNESGAGAINPTQLVFSSDQTKLFTRDNEQMSTSVNAYHIDQTTGTLSYYNSYDITQLSSLGVSAFLPVGYTYTPYSQYAYALYGSNVELYTKKSNGNFYDSGIGYFSGDEPSVLIAF